MTIAQTSKTVTGVVVSSEDNQPVVGASVSVKGTKLGRITDVNGKFIIPGVPNSAKTLVVTYVGMQPQEIAIKPGIIKIVMELKLDGSADEALRQIEEKGYALPFAKDSRKLYKIDVNFSSEIRGIVEWKIVEDNS
jgi:hypothetical protein